MLAFFWATTIASLRGVRASVVIGAVGTHRRLDRAGDRSSSCSVRRSSLQGNPLADPVLGRRARARHPAEQPGVPRRDHPAVHRHGDGRLPRPRDPRPGPDGAARDRPGVGGQCCSRCSARCSSRSSCPQQRDQPGLRDDGAVLQRARQASASGGCSRRSRSSWPSAGSPTSRPGSSGPPRASRRWPRQGSAPARLGRLNAHDVPVTAPASLQGIGGIDLHPAVPVRAQRQHVVLDALRGHRADHDHHVRADVRGGGAPAATPSPTHPRPYRIPGGLPGVWLVGGIGLRRVRGRRSCSASSRPASSRPGTPSPTCCCCAGRGGRAVAAAVRLRAAAAPPVGSAD